VARLLISVQQKWDLDAKKLPKDKALSFCYGVNSCFLPTHSLRHSRVAVLDVLNRVSRSFAIVIQQLGPELRDAVCSLLRPSEGAASLEPVSPPRQVCVFYLVLRGLDTVEDDMSIPDVR
jgi:farnesyl-diphosphate farnesyltransferase